MSSDDVRSLLDDLFEEIGLALGGLVALHPVADVVIRRLCDALTSIRRRAVARVTGESPRPRLADRQRMNEPHPAIEEFLARLDHR